MSAKALTDDHYPTEMIYKTLFALVLISVPTLAGAQGLNMSPSQMSEAQKKTYSAKAKSFTGKSCAQFVMYSSMAGTTMSSYKAGVDAMTGFQGQQGIKSLKKQQTSTVFQQQAQQGAKQQFIYSAFEGGKTTTLSCVLQ